jgi:hypothetical protein
MKSRGSDPPLSSIKSGSALLSILAALDGDPRRLLTRLRAGVATNTEQALAANLLDRKVRPRRPRPGSDRQSRFRVALLIRVLEEIWKGSVFGHAFLSAAANDLPSQLVPPQFRKMVENVTIYRHGSVIPNPELKKALAAAVSGAPPPDAKAKRKFILSLAREMASDKSTMMSEREAYYAEKEFNDAAFSQIINMKDDDEQNKLDHDTLVQMVRGSPARK